MAEVGRKLESAFKEFLALPAFIMEKMLARAGHKHSFINAVDPDFPRRASNTFVGKSRDQIAFDMLAFASLCYEKKEIVNAALHEWDADAQVALVGFPPDGVEERLNPDLHQAILWRGKEHTIVCFRGTEPHSIKEWLVDFSFQFRPIHSGIESPLVKGGVHSGFYGGLLAPRPDRPTVYQEIQQQLDAWDQRDGRLPVFITGHSLGGALSVVLAACMVNDQRADRIGGVYTFGQPRVGDQEFCRTLDAAIGDRVYRYVAGDDLIPRVPPNLTRFSEPLGTLVYMRPAHTASGVVVKVERMGETPIIVLPTLAESALRFGKTIVDGLQKKEKSLWTVVRALFPQHVLDHFPLVYARLLLPLLPAATPEAAAAAAAAAAAEADVPSSP